MAKLKKCPGCGKGGFINLKHHVCKAVTTAKKIEVHLVKPLSKKQLNDCADNIRRVYGTVGLRTREFYDQVIYDFVELGLYFLKVKESLTHGEWEDFVRDATTADESKPLVSVLGGRGGEALPAKMGANAKPVSFLPPVSVRTAQNYMNAARNAGLDVLSESEDVEALRKKKALHGMKATELYRLTDGTPEEEEEQPSRFSMIRQAAVNFRDECERLIEMRPNMSKKAFETVCARAHRTLEELTGSSWDMVEQRKGDRFKEHGDIYDLGS